MSPVLRSRSGWPRPTVLVTILSLLGLVLLFGTQQRGSEAASRAAPPGLVPPSSAQTDCKQFQIKPGYLNLDKGAPLGDYGDAPDGGHYFYPAGPPASTFFPTLFIHQGPYTVNTSQEWLGPRVSREHGATDPADPDGRPNLLIYPSAVRFAANLDCYDDSKPRLEAKKGGSFYANVSVTAAAAQMPHYLNVVADLNLNGRWDVATGTKEWVVRNCAFYTSPTMKRIQCPVVLSASLFPPSTSGHVVSLTTGPQACPPNVWFRVLLTRFPITSTTIPGPWKGWDGRGPKGGFPYGEVEDYHCPSSDVGTPTPTATRITTDVTTTPIMPATATATPSCVNAAGVVTCTPTATPSCVNAAGVMNCTPTVTATPDCLGANGQSSCTPTASPTPSCVNAAGVVTCTPTVTATPDCRGVNGQPACTPTASPTATCVPLPGTTLCAPTATVTPPLTATPNCGVTANGSPGCTATPTATATFVLVPGTALCAPTATPTCVLSSTVPNCRPAATATATCTVNPLTNQCQPTATATATCTANSAGLCQPIATATATCTPSSAGLCQPPATATATCTANPLTGQCQPVASPTVVCPTNPLTGQCLQQLDLTARYSYDSAKGSVSFCLATAYRIYDLEWLGAPWSGASTGAPPSGWSWQVGYPGGQRAFTTNTPPFTAGQTVCFPLTVAPGTALPALVPIVASNSSGASIGYFIAHP